MIARLTRGEVRLWQAFWLLYFGGGIVIQVAILGVAMTGAPGLILPGWTAVLPVAVVPLLYKAWAAVCVWRAAFNVEWRPWAIIARALVVFGLMLEAWRAIVMIVSEVPQ